MSRSRTEVDDPWSFMVSYKSRRLMGLGCIRRSFVKTWEIVQGGVLQCPLGHQEKAQRSVIAHGINVGDVKKLQDARIYTCNGLMKHTKKQPKVVEGGAEENVAMEMNNSLQCRINPHELDREGKCKVSDVETIQELIEKGNATRSAGTTGANEESSRSHASLQLAIQRSADGSESKPPRVVGKLSFIDLAGSE
ncbi:unnamed protein product [Camellia sinensis]